MNLIGLLVALIVICAIFWACRAILRAFGIGDPIATIVQVVLVLLVLLWLLSAFGLVSGGPSIRLRSETIQDRRIAEMNRRLSGVMEQADDLADEVARLQTALADHHSARVTCSVP